MHPADFFLAAKAIEQRGVAFHFGVRNFDGDCASVFEIGGAENRSHAAAGS